MVRLRGANFEDARADTAVRTFFYLKARGKNNFLCGRAYITTRKCDAIGDAAHSERVGHECKRCPTPAE